MTCWQARSDWKERTHLLAFQRKLGVIFKPEHPCGEINETASSQHVGECRLNAKDLALVRPIGTLVAAEQRHDEPRSGDVFRVMGFCYHVDMRSRRALRSERALEHKQAQLKALLCVRSAKLVTEADEICIETDKPRMLGFD